MRTEIAQRGVLPSPVVEPLDILDHIRFRLLARRIVALIGAFAFHTAKEPFGHGIVSARALATHTTPEPMDRQQALGVMTGIWTPAIRMVPEPRHRAAAAQGHPERCVHQSGINAVTHRPAHDLARRHIQQDRDVSPALGGPHIRDLNGMIANDKFCLSRSTRLRRARQDCRSTSERCPGCLSSL
jgi:hypothetical protein